MFCILLEYKHISYCLIWSEKLKSHFLVFWQMWMMARRFFFDRRTKAHNSLLFANPVAVPRLPDAIYLIRLFSHGFKNPRLFAFGLASFRRLFLITRFSKPSGRRGLSNPWNMEVSIIKAVWKTGIWIAGGLLSPRVGIKRTHNGVWKTRTFKPVEYGSFHHQSRL